MLDKWISRQISDKDLEFVSMKIRESMKAVGIKTNEMVRVTNSSVMEMCISAIIWKVKFLAKEFTSGLTETCMMASGSMVKSMAMAYGKILSVTAILDSGSLIWLMDSEFTNG